MLHACQTRKSLGRRTAKATSPTGLPRLGQSVRQLARAYDRRWAAFSCGKRMPGFSTSTSLSQRGMERGGLDALVAQTSCALRASACPPSEPAAAARYEARWALSPVAALSRRDDPRSAQLADQRGLLLGSEPGEAWGKGERVSWELRHANKSRELCHQMPVTRVMHVMPVAGFMRVMPV